MGEASRRLQDKERRAKGGERLMVMTRWRMRERER
jgi:hypothetical protein